MARPMIEGEVNKPEPTQIWLVLGFPTLRLTVPLPIFLLYISLQA